MTIFLTLCMTIFLTLCMTIFLTDIAANALGENILEELNEDPDTLFTDEGLRGDIFSEIFFWRGGGTDTEGSPC